MKRIISYAFGIFALLLTAMLVVPLLVDINKWKPEIEASVTSALGREFHIDGPISISILPFPGISLSSVRLGNSNWAKNKEMVRVDSVQMSLSFWKLFTKTFQFSQITLLRPAVDLEVSQSGEKNWDILASNTQSEKPDEDTIALGSWALDKSLPKISIREGSISLVEGDKTYLIDLNFTLNPDSIKGPYTLAGNIKYGGELIEFTSKLGKLKSTRPFKIDANIDFLGQRLEVIGAYNFTDREFSGQIASKLAPSRLAPEAHVLEASMTVTADVVANPQKIALSKLIISSGNDKAIGHFNLDFGPVTLYDLNLEGLPGGTSLTINGPLVSFKQLEGKLEFKSEQLRKLIDWLHPDNETYQELDKLTLNADYHVKDGEVKLDNLNLNASERQITGMVAIKLPEVQIDLTTPELGNWLQLVSKNQEAEHLGQAKLAGSALLNDEIALKLKLELDNGTLSAAGSYTPNKKNYNIYLDLSHPNLNQLLSAAGLEVRNLALGNLDVKARASGDTEKTTISQLKGSLGSGTSFTGEVNIELAGNAPKINGQLHFGNIKLNTLLADNGVPADAKVMLASSQTHSTAINTSLLDKIELNLDISADALLYNTQTFKDIKLPVAISGGKLALNNISANTNGGFIKGSAQLFLAETPQLEAHLQADNINISASIPSVSGGLEIHAEGKTPHEVLQTMSGKVNMTAKAVQIKGTDAASLEGAIKSHKVVDIGKIALTGTKGSTFFDQITMLGLIDKGILAVQNIHFQGPVIEGQGLGTINLVNQTMDINNVLFFKNVPKAPAFKVTVSGSIYNPETKVNASELTSYLVAASGKEVLNDAINLGKNAGNPKNILNPQGVLKGLLNQ